MTSGPDAPRSKFLRYIDRFLERLAVRFGDTPVGAQRAIYNQAMLLKGENAHRLAPQHPPFVKPHSADRILPAGEFVVFDAKRKFLGNPCFVARGMDKRTLYAALRDARGAPRDVEAFMAAVRAQWTALCAGMVAFNEKGRGTIAEWKRLGAAAAAQMKRQEAAE